MMCLLLFFSRMHACVKVQKLAQAAAKHTETCGGTVHSASLLAKLASLGAAGKFPNNAERDIHRSLAAANLKLDACIQWVQVRFQVPSTGRVESKPLPVLFPDKFAEAIWSMGEEYFQHFFLGGMDQDLKQFWQHVGGRSLWGKSLKDAAGAKQDLSRLIPLTFYGDDVNTYKSTEIGTVSVMSWSCDYILANQSPLERYFLICAFSEYHECPGTWADFGPQLAASFSRLVSDDRPWCKKGYRFCFSSITGDLKWIRQYFGMFNWKANEFCSYCNAVKRDPDGCVGRTLSDFSEDAEHRNVRIQHEDWLQSTSPAERVSEACMQFFWPKRSTCFQTCYIYIYIHIF